MMVLFKKVEFSLLYFYLSYMYYSALFLFHWKLFIWIPPPLKYCAAHGYLAVGSWQTWQKFLDPCLLVVSFMFLKVQASIFAWISIETDKTVFLQFSSSSPLVFLHFLGLIEAKTFPLQHFVETFVGFPLHKKIKKKND